MDNFLHKMNIQLFANEEGGDEEVVKDPTVDELMNSLNELKSKTVSREEYNKILESNKKLVREIANNRQVVMKEEEPTKELTKQDIIKRCEERTANLDKGTTLDKVKALTENYRDMQTLGMDVSNVDEKTVSNLEYLIEESKGNADIFKSLMESKIRV